MPDLLERGIQQSVVTDPRDGEAQHVRRRVQIGLRRCAARPEDHDASELIDAVDRSGRIVDGRRDRPERDIDDLDDAELDVLLHRARRADVDCAQQPSLALRRNPTRIDDPEQSNAGGDEMTDPPVEGDLHTEGFGAIEEEANIDKTYISGLAADDDPL